MPNHVTHRCIVTGNAADIKRFYKKAIVQDKDGNLCFDFNAFIPCPEELHGDAPMLSAEFFALGYQPNYGGSRRMASMLNALGDPLTYPWVREAGISTREELLAYLEANRPESMEKARRAIERVEKYGYCDFYGWCIDNWGTKWNSYEYAEVKRTSRRFEFLFDTAWSPPIPVIEKVAEEFPSLKFEIHYFDEGWGFAGTLIGRNGKVEQFDLAPSSKVYKSVYGTEPPNEEP